MGAALHDDLELSPCCSERGLAAVFINALDHTPVTRTRARIVVHADAEICRVDVAASPGPVWAKTSKGASIFFVRLNNSTRALPDAEVEPYCSEHWSAP